MLIVPDSNIFIADVWFNSQPTRVMLEYARKLGYKVVLLEAVEMEVRANIRRKIRSSLDKVEAAYANAARLGIDSLPRLDTTSIEIDIFQKWEKKLEIVTRRYPVVKTSLDNSVLPEVMRRATERIAPCSQSGKEVRDTVIWLSMLRLAEGNAKKSIAFISSNTKDFARDDKLHLRKELQNEINALGYDLSYFPSLAEFNAVHSEQFAYLNAAWVRERIDEKRLRDTISGELKRADESLFIIVDKDYDDYYRVQDIIEIVRLDLQIDDPVMVWDVGEDYLEIGLGISIYVEVDAECERIAFPDSSPYRSHLSYYANEFPQSRTLTCYAELVCHVGAQVSGDAVDPMEILGFDQL